MTKLKAALADLMLTDKINLTQSISEPGKMITKCDEICEILPFNFLSLLKNVPQSEALLMENQKLKKKQKNIILMSCQGKIQFGCHIMIVVFMDYIMQSHVNQLCSYQRKQPLILSLCFSGVQRVMWLYVLPANEKSLSWHIIFSCCLLIKFCIDQHHFILKQTNKQTGRSTKLEISFFLLFCLKCNKSEHNTIAKRHPQSNIVLFVSALRKLYSISHTC